MGWVAGCVQPCCPHDNACANERTLRNDVGTGSTPPGGGGERGWQTMQTRLPLRTRAGTRAAIPPDTRPLARHDSEAHHRPASAGFPTKDTSNWWGVQHTASEVAHPRSGFFSSGTRAVVWGELWAWLCLVDLSQTPSGTFFRRAHPGSEMATPGSLRLWRNDSRKVL